MKVSTQVGTFINFQWKWTCINEKKCSLRKKNITFGPIFENMLRNVPRRLAGTEQELLRLATDQNESQVDLQQRIKN